MEYRSSQYLSPFQYLRYSVNRFNIFVFYQVDLSTFSVDNLFIALNMSLICLRLIRFHL